MATYFVVSGYSWKKDLDIAFLLISLSHPLHADEAECGRDYNAAFGPALVEHQLVEHRHSAYTTGKPIPLEVHSLCGDR